MPCFELADLFVDLSEPTGDRVGRDPTMLQCVEEVLAFAGELRALVRDAPALGDQLGQLCGKGLLCRDEGRQLKLGVWK